MIRLVSLSRDPPCEGSVSYSPPLWGIDDGRDLLRAWQPHPGTIA